MDKQYQGEVFLSGYITSLTEQYPELEKLVATFRSYWHTGHHLHLGKDAPLHDPASIRQSAVRHIHLIPIDINTSNDKRWLRPFARIAPFSRPTSDRWLVYCVSANRNCCVLAYLKENAHFTARQGFFIGKMIDGAEAFFSDIEQYPLSESEQVNIFDDKWLIKDLSSDV